MMLIMTPNRTHRTIRKEIMLHTPLTLLPPLLSSRSWHDEASAAADHWSRSLRPGYGRLRRASETGLRDLRPPDGFLEIQHAQRDAPPIVLGLAYRSTGRAHSPGIRERAQREHRQG